MVIAVIGVSGSGKSTVGALLANALRCHFLDSDSLHPDENIARMSGGTPLTDADRAPWLAAVHRHLLDSYTNGQDIVVACSALKRSYRATLSNGVRVTWVYLKDRDGLIRRRIQERSVHFMPADLLPSQVATLEEPSDAIVPDISLSPDVIVEQILAELPVSPDVNVHEDMGALSTAAAATVVATIEQAVLTAGRCSLALSGGNAPRTLHRLLASRHRAQLPWSRIHVFWGDERYVPADDARSNHGMARETLLDHVPCPPENVHPIPTHFADPTEAAGEYERTLRGYFDGEWPRFDLVLLGMGEDGHTASLFPGSTARAETTRWVVAVRAPAEPPLRVTLTLPVLNRAAHIHFIVAGATKARAVARVLSGTADPDVYPAASVAPRRGSLTWWLDRAAAAERA